MKTSYFILYIIIWGMQLYGHRINAQETAFPYPFVPESISEETERVNYLLEHYWEQYEFTDTTRTYQITGEQGLVDFINLLQYTNTTYAATSIKQFVKRAFASMWGEMHYTELIEHYLGNPNSPIRNDLIYELFLQQIVDHYQKKAVYHAADSLKLQQSQSLLKNIKKNQVGSIATDFEYTTLDGKKSRLHKIKAELILIEFYDPNCEKCQRIDAAIANEPIIQNAPNLKLLKVNVENIHHQYFITSSPTFYLLSKEKRVLLKDPPIPLLLDYLKQYNGSSNECLSE